MRIAVLRTADSPCRCAEAVSLGLERLGHDPWIVDSESAHAFVEEICQGCDLVIDHTDTYRGQGALRAWVRLLLETRGARVVGSGASALLLADDKAAA